MGIGPVPAVATALERAGVGWEDVDLLEINEASAAKEIACLREWKLGEADLERVNVNGSGISLGHPIGATGGRVLANLLRELDRRGGRYGLETMCIGGGQGSRPCSEDPGVSESELTVEHGSAAFAALPCSTVSSQARSRPDPLEQGGQPLAAADAHRLQPVPGSAPVQLAQQVGEDPAAGRADGVAQRDARAVDVDPLQVRLAELPLP